MFNLITTPYVLTEDDKKWLKKLNIVNYADELLTLTPRLVRGNPYVYYGINIAKYFPRWVAYLRSYKQQKPKADVRQFFLRVRLQYLEQLQKYDGIPYNVFKFWLEHTSLDYNEQSLLYAITGYLGSFSSDAMWILPYCSLQFIFKLIANHNWLNEYFDLIRDCRLYKDSDFYFNSMGELREYHDWCAAVNERDLMLKNAFTFTYTPAFQELVERNGYKLPMTVNAFLVLGKRFHTCVASYQRYQDKTLKGSNNCSRVIYDETTHAELQMYPYGHHVRGICAQCKGKYNKPIKPTPAGIVRILDGLESLTPEDFEVIKRPAEAIQRRLLETPLHLPRVLLRLPKRPAQNN